MAVGLVGAALFFSRMATSGVSSQIAEMLQALEDVKSLMAEPENGEDK